MLATSFAFRAGNELDPLSGVDVNPVDVHDPMKVGGDGANRFAFRSALIDTAVIFAGGFAVMKAANAERRRDAAGNGRFEWVAPETGIGNGIAKADGKLHLFGRGMQGFDLRGERDVLRGEIGFENGDLAGEMGRAIGGEKFHRVNGRLLFDGDGHKAEERAIGLRKELDGAGVHFCGGDLRGGRTLEADSLAELYGGGSYGALLGARANWENQEQRCSGESCRQGAAATFNGKSRFLGPNSPSE